MNFSGEQAQRSRAFTRTAGGGPLWQFLRGFIKHPVMVGSIIPSSKVLIDRMLAPVDWANCKVFVEYGPGVGTFTEHVLARMAPDADVQQILADMDIDRADYILSGLPFSTLPPGVGPAIAAATADALRPGGAFLVYQFSPKVRQFIDPYFDRIDKGFEWVNIPPATLFWAWKD